MLNNRNILIIFLSFFALIGISTLFGYGTFKTRGDYENNTGNILLSADEKELVFYNLDDPYVSDALDANTVSLRASESMNTTYYMRFPIGYGEPNSVLATDGVQNAQLRWAFVDANLWGDPNTIALPTLTPGSRIFVDANGFPLYEDNDNAYFDDINDFAGFALGHIASGTRPNNYIQVYTLLDFEPTLFNTVIGRGSDDVATGPNSVTIGYGAGALLDEGYENALGGKDAGRYLQDANDNAGWGYKVIGGAGDGNISGDYTEYFIGLAYSGIGATYNILINGTTESEIDTTWGDDGFFGYEAGGVGTYTPYDFIQLDDGSIIASFYRFAYDAGNYAYLCKIDAAGELDTTWGNNGFFTLPNATAYWIAFYKILQDNDGYFYLFGGGGGEDNKGFVKVNSDGTFNKALMSGSYAFIGAVDAVWYDDDKTKVICITISSNFQVDGAYPVDIACVDLVTEDFEASFTGNASHAGLAYYGGGYKIRKLSDGDFVTFQNGSPTMQKFLADGSALDTTWGDSGTLDIGTFAWQAIANRITVDGDYIYCITVETVESVINNVIRKIDSTGTVVAQENIITGSNATYHCIQVLNDQLILGTTSSSPANYNIEFWSTDLEYESGFDLLDGEKMPEVIYVIYPDETTRYPTSLDVHRVTALGAHAASNVVEGADDGLYLGTYSGQYNTTDPNVFFLDNLDRGDYPGNQQHGMMYGYFDVDPNDQWLTFNVGELNLDFGRFDVNDVNVANDLTVAGDTYLTDVNITGTLDVNDVNVTGLTIAGFDEGSVLFTDVNGLVTQDNTNFTFTDANDTLFVKHLEATTDANSPQYYVGDSGTYITTDGSDNLTLTDAVTGTKTLAQLGSPTYIYIKAETQAEGDLHLSDGTNWGYSKAQIAQIRVVTSSTDWDLYILQNDNGYAADDATIGKFCRVTEVSGDATLLMNLPYEDEDDSGEVHLYFNDDSGANTADIYIIGYGLN